MIVVNISQCIQILNHHVVYFEYINFNLSIISQ